ncbi:hypothetical protein [Microbacterium sp.]|uniref:hypothetical protein n=1 Tax=Microbacterium sp. TaxID=51671 RepID=UPI0039E5407D
MLTLTVLADAPETPIPTMTVDPSAVTPGFAGFVSIAVIAVAVVLLLIDMLRRIRRARYRAEVAEELDAQLRAEAGEDDTDRDAGTDRGA